MNRNNLWFVLGLAAAVLLVTLALWLAARAG